MKEPVCHAKKKLTRGVAGAQQDDEMLQQDENLLLFEYEWLLHTCRRKRTS